MNQKINVKTGFVAVYICRAAGSQLGPEHVFFFSTMKTSRKHLKRFKMMSPAHFNLSYTPQNKSQTTMRFFFQFNPNPENLHFIKCLHGSVNLTFTNNTD